MPRNKYFPILVQLLPRTDPRYQKWLSSLKNRPSQGTKGKTKETDPRAKRISETFRLKRIDNFAVWREKALKEGFIPNSRRPFIKNENLAFLICLTLGDGNLSKFPRTECLNITLGTDKPELIDYTIGVIKKVINKKPSRTYKKDSVCINVRIYQKNLSKRLNIPLGARKELIIKLPRWATRNKKYLISLLKGLFEAEGSFSIHLASYTYNLSFSNRNISLLDEVQKALQTLGFHPERRSNAVRLRKKKEAISFEKLISFRQYPLI